MPSSVSVKQQSVGKAGCGGIDISKKDLGGCMGFLSLWNGARSVGVATGYFLCEVNSALCTQNDLTGLIIELTAKL